MPIETLRARAHLLMWLVTIPFVLLFAVLAMLVVAPIWTGRLSGPMLIFHLPMCMYVWAIWMVRQALKSIASGAAFGQVVPRLLLRIGSALFAGGLTSVFGVTLLTRLIYGRGAFASFDGAAITLGVVGATLVLLSHLLAQASAMREELDAFF
ncbi:DUF2975 domain-containing protein [Sphingomonas sp. R1]|uniref:DUF2975 domain-containing protein n=1 Tax=Sphingomonas sp. R1 TaxID=399176 RepID=UPI0022255DF8|nr:DUF2975 domain-containing protein [Sphingomonas sp. R1]UYY77303.1 DUF2975 domain-containing protein [Sphingomonas sp. R1]